MLMLANLRQTSSSSFTYKVQASWIYRTQAEVHLDIVIPRYLIPELRYTVPERRQPMHIPRAG